MSYKDKTDLAPDEARDRVWELARQINICMFVTWDGERQRARPLAATSIATNTRFISSLTLPA